MKKQVIVVLGKKRGHSAFDRFCMVGVWGLWNFAGQV